MTRSRAPAAATLAAGLAAFAICPRLAPAATPLPALMVAAVWLVAIPMGAAWLVSWKLRHPAAVRRRATVAALWWAPLSLTATHGSELSLLFAAVLAVSAGWALRDSGVESPEPAEPPRDWFELVPSIPAAAVGATFAAAVLLQGGIAIGLGGLTRLGALAFAAGVAMVVWRLPARRFRPASHAAASLLLLLVALMPYARRTPTWGQSSGAPVAVKKDTARQGKVDFAADVERGIILIPEAEPFVTLVPPVPLLRGNPFHRDRKELSIPFHGVYWLFQPPDERPPSNSRRVRGQPLRASFRINYAGDLKMEAHQHLTTPFDVSCCARLGIAVVNDDPESLHPSPVFLEVTLSDTTNPTLPRLSLGRRPLRTAPGPQGPAREVIEFDIPAAAAYRMPRFDEVTVIYHPHRWRAARSARVAVERLVFSPRQG